MSGPVYDNALRHLAAGELVALCRWLGIDADIGAVRLSEALPSVTQYADLVVGTRRGQLAQVEFVRQPTADLPWRMLEYRARLMRLEPQAQLTQHLVVLAGGTVPPELVDGSQLQLRFNVTYLREQDPGALLSDLALAPLASLGRVRLPDERPRLLRQALELIRRDAPAERARHLAGVAVVLAAIHLDGATIEAIGRESAMPISLEGTEAGRVIAQRAEARGRAQGEAEGRAQGELDLLARLLRHRFGADQRIPAVAERLLHAGEQEAVDAALNAERLDDLLP